MIRLNEILSIVDMAQRHHELERYARTLRVNPREAKNTRGEYVEEKLVILIYDSWQKRKSRNIRRFHFFSGTAVVTLLLLIIIGFAPRLLVRFYKEGQAKDRPRGKVLTARDKNGEVIKENGRPVEFEMMEGVYERFDDSGQLRFEYTYKDGQLKREKEFDKNGKLIADIQFP